MAAALRLAERGLGHTSPNPPVGCVIVSDGAIIGAGYHRQAGGPHAEIEALRNCERSPAGATAYVTLEPCNHTGRTGPCAHALVDAEIGRVVVGSVDPNPRVAGGGAGYLRAKGIAIEVGVLAERCDAFLRPWTRFIVEGRPWVTLKVAATSDGRSADATKKPQWVTGPGARRWVQRVRERSDVIVVGASTVRHDNPRLTARPFGRSARRHPAIAVLDTQLSTPVTARVCRPGTLFIASEEAVEERGQAIVAEGAEVVAVPKAAGGVELKAALEAMAQRGWVHVLVEAGPRLAGALISAQLVDSLSWWTAASFAGAPHELALGGEIGVDRLGSAKRLESFGRRTIGGDLLMHGRWPTANGEEDKG